VPSPVAAPRPPRRRRFFRETAPPAWCTCVSGLLVPVRAIPVPRCHECKFGSSVVESTAEIQRSGSAVGYTHYRGRGDKKRMVNIVHSKILLENSLSARTCVSASGSARQSPDARARERAGARAAGPPNPPSSLALGDEPAGTTRPSWASGRPASAR